MKPKHPKKLSKLEENIRHHNFIIQSKIGSSLANQNIALKLAKIFLLMLFSYMLFISFVGTTAFLAFIGLPFLSFVLIKINVGFALIGVFCMIAYLILEWRIRQLKEEVIN